MPGMSSYGPSKSSGWTELAISYYTSNLRTLTLNQLKALLEEVESDGPAASKTLREEQISAIKHVIESKEEEQPE